MLITLDFTEVEDKDFEDVPEGTHSAILFDIEETTSSNKGTPGLQFTFKILGGEYDGQRVWETYWNTSGAMFRIKNALDALAPTVDHSGKLDFNPEDYVGIECDIEVEHGEYNGNTQVNVAEILENDAGGETSEPF